MENAIKYIDIHSHLHFDSYDEDREELLSRMNEEGVATISIGIDSATSVEEVELSENNDNIFTSIGIHPGDSSELFEDKRETFERLLRSEKVVSIGECGFDYSHLEGDIEKAKRLQEKNFEAQVDFAVLNDLPVMIHTRDADEDTVSFLESKKREHGDRLRGNVHFFTQSLENARRYLEIDFTISFTGVITFTDNYNEPIEFAPLDKIHGETDAPFVAPVPNRGKRNEPTFVKYVYDRIADIRGEDREKVRKQLLSNARRDFGLNRP
ncbi:MAG: TatD family hydrolase [Candidatus Campbellbacteria bacterium]|nr:TatD family hydrolase [Candidatus Campbellbacteria bacterium]